MNVDVDFLKGLLYSHALYCGYQVRLMINNIFCCVEDSLSFFFHAGISFLKLLCHMLINC